MEEVELRRTSEDGSDVIVRLRQERRSYSDVFQMYRFIFTFVMNFSNGGDVELFVSTLLNLYGDATERLFELILNTCLRNVNLQHFDRNELINTDYVQFNVEHTDLVDYVYSSRSVRFSELNVRTIVGELMNWLHQAAQSERKIDVSNVWRMQLSISRTDENAVPRGSGNGDGKLLEKVQVQMSTTTTEIGHDGFKDEVRFVPNEVVQMQDVKDIEEDEDEEDDVDDDDDYDDDKGRHVNEFALRHLVERDVNGKMFDYCPKQGELAKECLLVSMYVAYLRLTQKKNFSRFSKQQRPLNEGQTCRKLKDIAKRLGDDPSLKGGRGHWMDVTRIRKELNDEFNFSKALNAEPGEDFMCVYRQNCNKDLDRYPVYVLSYELHVTRFKFKKLFGLDDDGLFPNLDPIVVLLRDGHYYNVWDYASLFVESDTARSRVGCRGSFARYKKRYCLRCMVSFSNDELHVCEDRCRRCLQNRADHDDFIMDYDDVEGVRFCAICNCPFSNDFCYEAHAKVKFSENGRFESYCDLLSSLDRCSTCVGDFELRKKCRHKMKRGFKEREEGLVAHKRIKRTVRCGYCSASYAKGSKEHKCFLSRKDSMFGNEKKRSRTIAIHNVFYYDMESRLERKFECKFQEVDEIGNVKTLRKTVVVGDSNKVETMKKGLSKRELDALRVVECKSHVPTLVCVVGQSIRKHFCEKQLGGEDPVKHFLVWCTNEVLRATNRARTDKNDYVFVAHNASAYDCQFVYKTAHEMFGSRNVNVLIHMNKMIELKIQIPTGHRLSTLLFKDSYKFINLPLREMPRSFGFLNELQKGFFPHNLNTKDNLNLRLHRHLPERDDFEVDKMNGETKKRFEEWYVSESREIEDGDGYYDLREEMIKYCYDDCFVLRDAFNLFNSSMIKELKASGVKLTEHTYTILADFITLPQMVIHWYVGAIMEERKLSVVPHRGYDWGKCGSLKERLWLMWLDRINVANEGDAYVPIRSRYTTAGQERIGRYFLDGYRQLQDGARVCYEFYGCYYHGCLSCFVDRNKVVRKKHREDGHWTVRDAYDYTKNRELEIKEQMGYREGLDAFIVMWEHEFNLMEGDLRKAMGKGELYGVVDRLNPRDAVKGGRTEAFRLHCSVTNRQREEIVYLDVNSLYPYVMSQIKFPIGHPEIRRGDESCRQLMDSLEESGVRFIGLCMVEVLPPDELFVPCLGYKAGGKLLFGLCRTCLESNDIQRKPCNHSDKERGWIDVYTSIDMETALKCGYKVVRYMEVWHYHSGGELLFKDFILNIVRRKVECSGFPQHCDTKEGKEAYLSDLRTKCGIPMDGVETIKKDPAGRYLNKIMANSVWGKWAQNPSSQYEIKMCNTIMEYHECLLSGRVKRATLLCRDVLQVEVNCDRNVDGENRERENARSGLGGRNTIVGSFVTAEARRLMYERYLSKLGRDQLLYTDTDSVIMYRDKANESHVELPTSDLLGDLKDEYGELLSRNPGWYVKEFFAYGPKMYHLLISDGNRIVKWDKTMKGIKLGGREEMFDFDKIDAYRNPVLDYCRALQGGSEEDFSSMADVRRRMSTFECERRGIRCNDGFTVAIIFNQRIFKKDLSRVMNDNFVMTVESEKRVRVTQSKRYPRPHRNGDVRALTFPIGWR